jgi:hypothetical protein
MFRLSIKNINDHLSKLNLWHKFWRHFHLVSERDEIQTHILPIVGHQVSKPLNKPNNH